MSARNEASAAASVEPILHTFPNGRFRLDPRFSPDRVIGSGAYGMVCSALDSVSRKKVAIKKISSAFTMIQVAKRTLREIKLLKHFHAHPNIVSILTIQRPPATTADFKDLYVVLELQECDLHRIIHSDQPLSEAHVRYFLYQLLCGLKYIHSANVLHRDIKPGNLLINSDCSLRIGDFGMAREMASKPEQHQNFMTEYVATRWYRAPEVLLSFDRYTQAIDMWSVGCILAEMLGRRHLFPGKDYLHQLGLILSLLGSPSEDVLDRIGSSLARRCLQNFQNIPALDLHTVFPDARQDLLNLLSLMLTFDPEQRVTVDQALENPFFQGHRRPDLERVCEPFSFDFEERDVGLEELQKMVHDEALEYHTPGTRAFLHAQMALPKVTVRKRTSSGPKQGATNGASTHGDATPRPATNAPAKAATTTTNARISSEDAGKDADKGEQPAKKRKPRPLNKVIHPEMKPQEEEKLNNFRRRFQQGYPNPAPESNEPPAPESEINTTAPPPDTTKTQPAAALPSTTTATTGLSTTASHSSGDSFTTAASALLRDTSFAASVATDAELLPDGMTPLTTADLLGLTAATNTDANLAQVIAPLEAASATFNITDAPVDLAQLERELELGSPLVFKR